MSSRLRKMFFVNAKASGSVASGRICEIDPRGGAAITGDNGAGKTTTMQVIALFFGYSPTQLVQTGENRESMLRFILPHPESAIVFEYERGSADDVCHVIVRREDNTDVGDYRFVRGPMRKELFVATDATGEEIFLDDEGTRQVAFRLGMAEDITAKMKLAAYRSVILNVPTVGKSNSSRRDLAHRFSFSHRPLAHLDRLVAAVIKEHLHFDDFAEVAATIVMDKMHKDVSQTSRDKQLQLRQSRTQIEQWLRDRDAVERALKLEPDVNLLRGLCDEIRILDLQIGNKRSDCTQLIRINEALLDGAGKELQDLQSRRDASRDAFNLRKPTLQEAIQDAIAGLSKKTTAYELLRNRKQYLDENDASFWSQELKKLEGLRGEHFSQSQAIQSLQGQAQGILNNYAEQIRGVERDTEHRVEIMRKDYDTARNQLVVETNLLNDQEVKAIDALRRQAQPAIDAANNAFETGVAEKARADAIVSHPQIDSGLEDRFNAIKQDGDNRKSDLINAQSEMGKTEREFNLAERQADEAQRTWEAQKTGLINAKQAVESLTTQLQPAQDSLHAALINGDDDAWTETLAKIIDPALLSRKDLQLHFVGGERDHLAFGWGLNLEAITRPQWVDQEDLKSKLEEASAHFKKTETHVNEARAVFESASQSREDLREQVALKRAAVNVATAKLAEVNAQILGIENIVIRARENAKAEAVRAALTAKEKLEDARKAQKSSNDLLTNGLAAKQEEFRIQREQASNRCDSEILKIDDRIKSFRDRQNVIIADMEDAKLRELKDAGIDTEKLSKLLADLKVLADQVRTIEDKASLGREWELWQSSQGANQLVNAQEEMAQAEIEKSRAENDLTLAERAFNAETAQFGREESAIKHRADTAESELSILNKLAPDLDEFAPGRVSSMTQNDLASALKGEASALLDKFRSRNQSLRAKMEKVENGLCESESSTRKFVTDVMKELAEDASGITRASSLTRVYDRIRPEVMVNVNTSLRTMLDGIRHYRETISTFESEVRKFNTKLQSGLARVSSKFERFKDFKVNVVTDLDKIDFIGKLKLLDDVIADHRDRSMATYSLDLPSAQSAQALRTFMGSLSSGTMDIELGKHITLSGSVTDDKVFKTFHSARELEKISSNGLTAIALISLLSGLLNVIREEQPIYIPWVTDEVGRFDGPDFKNLMQMMAENRIDAVTASPALTPATYAFFAQRYVFKPMGVIAVYRDPERKKVNTLPGVA